MRAALRPLATFPDDGTSPGDDGGARAGMPIHEVRTGAPLGSATPNKRTRFRPVRAGGGSGMDLPRPKLAAEDVEATPFEIPGATGGTFLIQILNEDAAKSVVTTIVHLPPGGRIPAHLHRAGPEMHFVLEGDLVEAGEELGPGAFLTHAAGVVHGPHESRNGARC